MALWAFLEGNLRVSLVPGRDRARLVHRAPRPQDLTLMPQAFNEDIQSEHSESLSLHTSFLVLIFNM